MTSLIPPACTQRRCRRRIALALAVCVLPSLGTASIYQTVPLPAPSLLPHQLGGGEHAPLRHLTVNGAPVEARTWSAHGSMTEIREALRQMVRHEYDAYQASKRKSPKFDRDQTRYWALPRIVATPGWCGVLRLGSGDVGTVDVRASRPTVALPATSLVSLILPTASPTAWTVWESAMPTRDAFRLMVRDTATDVPGRDHPKAGRPSGSIRTFAVEEMLAGVRNFSATYATALAPLAAGGEVVQRLVGNGFRVRRKSEANGQLLAELQDPAAEVTVYAMAGAAAGQPSQVVVTASERAQ